MPKADGSNDKKVSFSAIWRVVAETLLNRLMRFSGELSANLALGLFQVKPVIRQNAQVRPNNVQRGGISSSAPSAKRPSP
jgi:hypothetical protein